MEKSTIEEKAEEKIKKRRRNYRMGGLILLGLFLVMFMIRHYLIPHNSQNNIFSFCLAITIIGGLLLIIPWHLIPLIIFDNEEYKPNISKPSMVEKIRLRALLFNNISVIIFFFTIFVILMGFFLLVYPPVEISTSDKNFLPTSLTIRIGASVLLIFLVQILFRVFKYLLRVAAFYNAKADAIEFNEISPEIGLDKLMELFTPDKYDISDLQQTSISDSVTDTIRKLIK